MISINDAARLGIERIRKPIWANRFDHVKLDFFDGQLGPWVHLWAPFNTECNGRDPVDLLWAFNPFDTATPEYVPYEGPLPASPEYQAEVNRFAGCLAD